MIRRLEVWATSCPPESSLEIETGSTYPRIHQEGVGVHVTRRSRPRTTSQSWPGRALLRVINILKRSDICVTEHKYLLATGSHGPRRVTHKGLDRQGNDIWSYWITKAAKA